MNLFKKTVELKLQIETRIIEQFKALVIQNKQKLDFKRRLVLTIGGSVTLASFLFLIFISGTTNTLPLFLSLFIGIALLSFDFLSLQISSQHYFLFLNNPNIEYITCKFFSHTNSLKLNANLTHAEIESYINQNFSESQIIYLTEYITSGKKIDFDCFLELEKLSNTALLQKQNLLKNEKNEALNDFFENHTINIDIKEQMKQHLHQSFDNLLLSKEIEMNYELKKLL